MDFKYNIYGKNNLFIFCYLDSAGFTQIETNKNGGKRKHHQLKKQWFIVLQHNRRI